jgi:DnaJ-class molecular chaperone
MDPQKRAHYDRNRESVIRNGWSEQESTRVYENYDADLDEIFREFYGYDNYHYEHVSFLDYLKINFMTV